MKQTSDGFRMPGQIVIGPPRFAGSESHFTGAIFQVSIARAMSVNETEKAKRLEDEVSGVCRRPYRS